MVDLGYAFAVRGVFSLAAGTLLGALGLLLLLRTPSSWAQRALGGLLVVEGSAFNLASAAGYLGLAQGLAPGHLGSFVQDLWHLKNPMWLAFLVLFPRPPAWRSWHAVALAGAAALVVGNTLVSFFAPEAWFRDAASGRITVLGWVLLSGWGHNLAWALGLATAVDRLRMGAPAERPGGYALAVVPYATLLGIAGYTVGGLAGELLGLDQGFSAFRAQAVFTGDWGFLAWLVLDLSQGLVLLLVAWMGWQGAYGSLLIGGVGLAMWPITEVLPVEQVGIYALPQAAVLLWALARKDVFGWGPLGPSSRWILGGLFAAAAFAGVGSMAASLTSDPFAISTAAVLGLVIGAVSLIPLGLLEGPRSAPEPGGAALAAYRRAYEDAVRSGLQGDALRARLRPLRADLGLTDRDHAVLEHALQAGDRAKPNALEPGATVLGRYRIVERLGEGAFGTTFLAEDTVVRRRVVIKALRTDPAEGTDVLREARAIGAVKHPHVVTLYDVEQVGSRVFIVMEHVEGGSLAARLATGPMGPAEFRRVATGTLAALESIHEAGLVHRDVKPSNILLTASGQPKLADFGIAAMPGGEATIAAPRGTPLGTLRYMSPEQARGARATPRSDVYSLGATLYEAVTGEPYLERGEDGTADLQFRAAYPEPFGRRPKVPEALRPWLAKALQPEAAMRHPSAAAMRGAMPRSWTKGAR